MLFDGNVNTIRTFQPAGDDSFLSQVGELFVRPRSALRDFGIGVVLPSRRTHYARRQQGYYEKTLMPSHQRPPLRHSPTRVTDVSELLQGCAVDPGLSC